MRVIAARRVMHQPRLGARSLLLAGFGLLAIFGVAAMAAYLYDRPSPLVGRVDAGAASKYPEHTVTYVAQGRFFLVHETGADFFALFEQSPWLQRVHPEGWEQCHARWYTLPAGTAAPLSANRDYVQPPTAINDAASGTAPDRGYFWENCDGWMFDVYGNHLFGASTALDRYAVLVSRGHVIVDTTLKLRTAASWPAASTSVPTRSAE